MVDGEAGPADGWAVHCVVRNGLPERIRRALRPRRDEEPQELVEEGPLAAAVTPARSSGDDDPAPEELRRHHRIVRELADRGTVLPLSWGFVARDRQAVRRFLRESRERLEEGLEFLDGGVELRLHVRPREGSDVGPQLREVFLSGMLQSLRAHARSARRLPADHDAGADAAFLVERDGWERFRERALRWEERGPGVELEVTGPWPPYDFVRLDSG